MTPQVILKPKRAQPFFGRHPWVFAGAVDRVEGDPADGAEVILRSSAGNFIAYGLYNSQSKIVTRLYSWSESQRIDEAFFRERIRSAIRLRHDSLKLNRAETPCYRVVFSEGDGLSGLIADRFGGWLSLQCTARVIAERREMIGLIFMEELQLKGIYLRTEKGIGKLEGLELRDSLLMGEPPPAELIVEEQGLKFAVNLSEGQKTGFYLDQRDNRQAVANYCEGRRVLDAFCYSGGFGLHASKVGAKDVVCVDSSDGALTLVKRNLEINNINNVECRKADVFKALQSMSEANEKYDVIVLDPPKFARDRKTLPEAMKGYRKLFQSALNLLNDDGIIAFCCCTGLITMDQLEDVIQQTAASSEKSIQILERRGPGADHPVAITCREGHYLKCIITRVTPAV